MLGHRAWTSRADKAQRGLSRVGDHTPPEAVGHLLGPQNLSSACAVEWNDCHILADVPEPRKGLWDATVLSKFYSARHLKEGRGTTIFWELTEMKICGRDMSRGLGGDVERGYPCVCVGAHRAHTVAFRDTRWIHTFRIHKIPQGGGGGIGGLPDGSVDGRATCGAKHCKGDG